MEKHGRVSRTHDLGNSEIIAQDATNVDKGLGSDLHRTDVSHQKWTKIVLHKLDKVKLTWSSIFKFEWFVNGAKTSDSASHDIFSICMYVCMYVTSAYNFRVSIYEFWVLPTETEIELIIRIVCCSRQHRDPRFPQPSNLDENSFSELAKVFSKFSCSERLVPTPTQVSDLGFSTPSSHHTPPIHCSITQALTLLKSLCLVFPHNHINLPS